MIDDLIYLKDHSGDGCALCEDRKVIHCFHLDVMLMTKASGGKETSVILVTRRCASKDFQILPEEVLFDWNLCNRMLG